jgi:hypothetical protein
METATLNMSGIYQDQSNLIPLDPQTFIQKALDLLASDRYLEKGMGWWLSPGANRLRSSLAPGSVCLPSNFPSPALIFEGQLKTRHAPGTSFEPYPIPVLAEPKLIIRALDQLRTLKTFASADAVNTTTGPQLP